MINIIGQVLMVFINAGGRDNSNEAKHHAKDNLPWCVVGHGEDFAESTTDEYV